MKKISNKLSIAAAQMMSAVRWAEDKEDVTINLNHFLTCKISYLVSAPGALAIRHDDTIAKKITLIMNNYLPNISRVKLLSLDAFACGELTKCITYWPHADVKNFTITEEPTVTYDQNVKLFKKDMARQIKQLKEVGL